MIFLVNYCMCVLIDSGVVLSSLRDSFYFFSFGNNASTNLIVLNDCKFCIDLLMLMNLMGIFNLFIMFIIVFFCEVLLSLVKMIFVTFTVSLKTRVWLSMFNLVVLFKMSKILCGVFGKCLEMEFFILINLFMSWELLCNCSDVFASTTSTSFRAYVSFIVL